MRAFYKKEYGVIPELLKGVTKSLHICERMDKPRFLSELRAL